MKLATAAYWRAKRLAAAFFLIAFLQASGQFSRAEMVIHPYFRDHMVLQREKPVPIWGWAMPGDRIDLTFDGQRKNAVADSTGRWQITLDPMTANAAPQDMVIAESDGSAQQTLRDVLIGEVWLCAGQSNMLAMTSSLSTGPQLIRDSDHPQLRLYRVDARSAQVPEKHFERGSLGPMLPAEKEALDDTALKWQVASPGAVATFSGVAYNFGRLLHADLHIPVGIVEVAFGGTTAEQWTPRTALAEDPQLAPLLTGFNGFVTDPAYPGGLYNGSIAPLQPAAFRGVVWYQGESNSDTYERAAQYKTLLRTLITSWRTAWGSELPFLVVQIASFHEAQPEPSDAPLAHLRESQASVVRELPNSALVVAIDLGVADDWHPANKSVLGQRMEAAAMKCVYGRDVIASGPQLAQVSRSQGSLTLTFTSAGSGLLAQNIVSNRGKYHVNPDHLAGFAIAGPDHCFYWAKARITGTHVELSSPNVPHPIDVRYAWAAFPMANLANAEGFPAPPFRTDDLPSGENCISPHHP
jgi:sialate O-acetylesterase